jgi:hypothetical protein
MARFNKKQIKSIQARAAVVFDTQILPELRARYAKGVSDAKAIQCFDLIGLLGYDRTIHLLKTEIRAQLTTGNNAIQMLDKLAKEK